MGNTARTRHRGLLGGVLALRDNRAARLLDGPNPNRAVLPHAGEHDDQDPLAKAVGQRLEEEVERFVARHPVAGAQGKGPVGQHLQALSGRTDLYVAGLETGTILSLCHMKCYPPAQDSCQSAPLPAEVLRD